MTEEQIQKTLKDRGCPEFVWKGGSQYLIDNWKKFIEEVERGYCPDCLLDEYLNDLDTRTLIRLTGLDDKVKDLDERFKAMLIRTDLRISQEKTEIDNDFWNFGYPKNAKGYFLQEILRVIKG